MDMLGFSARRMNDRFNNSNQPLMLGKSRRIIRGRRPIRRVDKCSGTTKIVALAVLALSSMLVLSVGAKSAIKTSKNMKEPLKASRPGRGSSSQHLRGGVVAIDRYSKFNEDEAAVAADHLVIVAGHSVIMPTLPSIDCDGERVSNENSNYYEDESV